MHLWSIGNWQHSSEKDESMGKIWVRLYVRAQKTRGKKVSNERHSEYRPGISLWSLLHTIMINSICQNLYQSAKESSHKRCIVRNIFVRVNILTILNSPLGAYKYGSSNSIDRLLIFISQFVILAISRFTLRH